jgi:hypothetical protein
MRHPVAGELVLTGRRSCPPPTPDQAVIFWTAEPGSSTRDALARLAAGSGTDTDTITLVGQASR